MKMEQGQSQNSLQTFLVVVIVAGVVFFALFLYNCCQIIGPGYRGVYVVLGKSDSAPLGEGFHLVKPFISKVEKVSVKQETFVGRTECFSSDLQQVALSYAVLCRIPESQVVTLFRDYKGDYKNSLIVPRIDEITKQFTANYRAEDLVKKRDHIRVLVLQALKERVGDIVEIRDFNITNLDLSKELEKAIELKVVREQEALAKNYELEKAKKDAEMTLVQAKAEAESVRIKGEALKNSPTVVELEAVKKWDGKLPNTFVTDGKSLLLPIK